MCAARTFPPFCLISSRCRLRRCREKVCSRLLYPHQSNHCAAAGREYADGVAAEAQGLGPVHAGQRRNAGRGRSRRWPVAFSDLGHVQKNRSFRRGSHRGQIKHACSKTTMMMMMMMMTKTRPRADQTSPRRSCPDFRTMLPQGVCSTGPADVGRAHASASLRWQPSTGQCRSRHSFQRPGGVLSGLTPTSLI
jgi:hypothetical protein